MFQTSGSTNVLTQFTPNPVYLKNSDITLLKLIMTAKENHPSEEKILVSAVPHSSSKEIKLFSRNVKVISQEENLFSGLKSLVPSGKVVISAGATVRVNFTVINVGREGHVTFKVSKPPDIYQAQHKVFFIS